MNLKIALNPNPILSVAAAVVAYASGADAQDYNADYDNETCKNTPPQAWGAKFATIEGCCTSALFWVEDCVANSNGVTPTPAPSESCGTTLLERYFGLYCMQVYPSDGYRIKSATCDASNPYQQFYLTPDRFVKVTAEPSKCLDQPHGVSDLYVFDCHGGNNQQWIYDPETKTLSSVHNGACADFNFDSTYLTNLSWWKQPKVLLGFGVIILSRTLLFLGRAKCIALRRTKCISH
jgi:hypothetical protein